MHPFAEAGAKGAAPRSAEGKVSRRAETLRSGLQAIVAGDTGTRLTLLSRQGLTLSSEAGRRLYACCRPDGHGVCDHNSFERAMNVISSVPYTLIGLHTLRKRNTAEGRAYGISLVGVGVGSLIYHSSSGRWRNFGRKLDYWAISLSSTALLRAVTPVPARLTAAALALTPFQPFAVAACNGAAVEAQFLRRARRSDELRRRHQQHLWTSAVGGALFALEEVAPRIPLIHTSWHILSAYGVAATNALLTDVETNRSFQF